MGRLYDKLTEYDKSDFYPYHMPGHKRNMKGRPFEAFWGLDITEIDGFDNLHQAEGILLEIEERANRMYGAEETFLLINGSTCGILSAVAAAVKPGGKLLMARNCHKSVYHGAYLGNLEVRYVYPEKSEQFGIALGVKPDKVEEALKNESGISAVVVTSPTYEGVVSDIGAIADIVHRYGIPLIVDEAHGAHFGFAEELPDNAIAAGADLVIHSLHKTLPAPTQTALLHVMGKRIDRERLKRYLGIYQSSSPSYPLMTGIELCLDIVEQEGKAFFEKMLSEWAEMLLRLEACRALRILRKEDVLRAGMKDFDVGKLVISTEDTNWSGKRLYEVLLREYHLQLEMAADTYVLAMFTVMDTEEGYRRLTEAVLEIDERICAEGAGIAAEEAEKRNVLQTEQLQETDEQIPETVCRIAEALDAEKEWISLSECRGRIAADFINLYPPGIPVIVPGEIYSREIINNMEKWCKRGLSVQGMNEKGEIPVAEGAAKQTEGERKEQNRNA